MSKFKVGDTVRIIDRPDNGHVVGDIGTVQESHFFNFDWQVSVSGKIGAYNENELELVTSKGETMARRTFRLLKDTATVKKGAIYQEQCDDGTQPYEMITDEFNKGDRSYSSIISERSLVEDQPDWFVEVFNPADMWVTKEELDKIRAAMGAKKRGRPVGSKNKKSRKQR